MDRRTIRRYAGLAAGLAALAALAVVGNRTGARLFGPLEDTGLRRAVLVRTRPPPLRNRFPGLKSPLVIQQIGLADSAGPVRSDGFPSDWIEVLNQSLRPVSLDGFTLADGPALSRRWTFPDVELPGGASLIVWADGLDRIGSRWESRDPLQRPPGAWARIAEEDSPAGYVFRAARAPHADRDPVLVHQVDLPEAGRYDL